ncbi:MAG: thiosulfate oxidation carrier complex protein SoxZ [Rhodospirillales bacterium]|nr:thiosulfate oxidation carrier complex protein SoxZ [Rhodospirillales bacterium]
MAIPLVNAPARVRRGEVFEVKTLVAHPMETGFRPGMNGTLIPRDIVQRLRCRFAGADVIDVALSPAVAANPYVAFHVRAERSGTLELTWTGDNGFSASHSVAIAVE